MQKLSLDDAMSESSAELQSTQAVSSGQQRSTWDQMQTDSLVRPVSTLRETTGTPPMQKKAAGLSLVIMLVLAIGAGVATGYGGFKLKAKGTSPSAGTTNAPMQQVAGDSVKVGQIFGVQDEKTFKDNAEGYLEDGGIGGEGSHKLLRAGGVSQTVVLTSSVTDLSKFSGMQVKVWGETFKAQKAGWLMDVGRVQVVETKGQAPTEE